MHRFSILPNHISYELPDEEEEHCLVGNISFSEGVHEFEIQIMSCDVYKQEVGIVSFDDNHEFGAKAIYSSELATDEVFYASYDSDGKQRCRKSLVGKTMHNICWTESDTITVKLDCDKNKIKWLLNGQKVRKSLSLEAGNVWFPYVSYVGRCQYSLTNFDE